MQVQQKVREAETVADAAANPNAPTQIEQEAVKEPCDDAKTPEESVACAQKEFEQTNAELNKVYGGMMQKLQAKVAISGNNPDKKIVEAAKKAVQNIADAEEKWTAYRDANCNAEKDAALTEANPAFIGISCQQRMTEQRIDDLKLIYTK